MCSLILLNAKAGIGEMTWGSRVLVCGAAEMDPPERRWKQLLILYSFVQKLHGSVSVTVLLLRRDTMTSAFYKSEHLFHLFGGLLTVSGNWP